MITDKVEDVRKWDYTEHLACENCGRTKDLHRIFIKNNIRCKELCFCGKCWTEIMDSVWPFQEWRKNEPRRSS
jgi:hypothetical protein